MRLILHKALKGVFAMALCSFIATAEPLPLKSDGMSVTLTGTVVSIAPEKGQGFVLSYGKGKITVEVDDWDVGDHSVGLTRGEKVTVTGRIDKDKYETKSIEAESVYAHQRNLIFHGKATDEEETYFWAGETSETLDSMTISGKVRKIHPITKSFILDAGIKQYTVITDDLGYNPYSGEGLATIREGDRVNVTGPVDYDLWTKDDIRAKRLVKPVRW